MTVFLLSHRIVYLDLLSLIDGMLSDICGQPGVPVCVLVPLNDTMIHDMKNVLVGGRGSPVLKTAGVIRKLFDYGLK